MTKQTQIEVESSRYTKYLPSSARIAQISQIMQDRLVVDERHIGEGRLQIQAEDGDNRYLLLYNLTEGEPEKLFIDGKEYLSGERNWRR